MTYYLIPPALFATSYRAVNHYRDSSIILVDHDELQPLVKFVRQFKLPYVHRNFNTPPAATSVIKINSFLVAQLISPDITDHLASYYLKINQAEIYIGQTKVRDLDLQPKSYLVFESSYISRVKKSPFWGVLLQVV